MQGTHLAGERGLVTHCRGHAAQESRHLATCLGKAEDIVHKEENILTATILVAELLGHGEARQGYAQTCARGFVHLSEDECGLRLLDLVHVDLVESPFALSHRFLEFVAILDDAALNHLAQQVVTLTGTLAYSGEYREAVVALRDIVDEFHD